MRKTVFVVDDTDSNLAIVEEGLEDHYRVITLPSGARMFEMLEKIKPDLILLDIEMPDMNGFQVLEKLKNIRQYADIPIIFLTGVREPEREASGLHMGAVDFVSKPFSVPVLLNRVKLHIDINELIKARTAELERANRNLLFVLADIVESRDKSTGGHIDRTTQYIVILIENMIKQGVYADELRSWDLDNISICSALHDVGKISISDNILNKPERLTDEERSSMEKHAEKGVEIIKRVISRTGGDKLMYNARLFAEYHHENWDGTGYPHGLMGVHIPLQGRIMAIADVYDALVSERSYKKAFTDEEAVDIIMKESGTKFDPELTKVFYSIRDQFAATHKQQQGQ